MFLRVEEVAVILAQRFLSSGRLASRGLSSSAQEVFCVVGSGPRMQGFANCTAYDDQDVDEETCKVLQNVRPAEGK